jgi:hypothetical protein
MRHPIAAAEPPRVAGSAREAKTWGAEELASFAIPALQEEAALRITALVHAAK